MGFGCFSSSVGGFLCFFEMMISGLGGGEDPHQDQERPEGGGLPPRPGGGPFSAQEERRPRKRSGSTTKARRSARRREYFYVSLSFPSLPILVIGNEQFCLGETLFFLHLFVFGSKDGEEGRKTITHGICDSLSS